MPPHRQLYLRLRSILSSTITLRVAPACITLALTGCAATNSGNDYAALDDLFSDLNDNYSYRTQADPLGNYLANRAQSDIRISYGSNQHNTNHAGQEIASTALDFLGINYRYGGENPNTGFDCSGLVSYVDEKSLGLKLPRQSAQMASFGESVKRSQLEEGDLVFFNTRGARFSHVGIYLGDNKFVHAPRTGAVVRVEDMTVSYWKKRYNGARRIIAAK